MEEVEEEVDGAAATASSSTRSLFAEGGRGGKQLDTMLRRQQLNPLAPAYVPTSRALKAATDEGGVHAPPGVVQPQQEALSAALQLAELPEEVCVVLRMLLFFAACCGREREQFAWLLDWLA